MSGVMRSLYIHIPFCRRICTYCDFAKEVAHDPKQHRYIDALIDETRAHSAILSSVRTVYIGGGTPSSLPLHLLERYLSELNAHLSKDAVEEFTVEANPSDVTPQFAALIRRMNITRVSLGAQTFDNATLAFLNRDHHAEMIGEAVKNLRTAGLTNINVDMIFAYPAQTHAQLREDLKKLLALKPAHISYYNLIFEPGTRLYTLYTRGETFPLDDDTQAQMYETVIDTLKDAGYTHYEISSFARKGFNSAHNTYVWRDYDYLGLGSGAHSKYGNVRYENPARLKHYLQAVEMKREVKIPYPYETPTDTMLMGMRLLEGIDLEIFAIRFQQSVYDAYPFIKDYIAHGLLRVQDGRLQLTRRGLLMGNEIFARF